MGSPARSNITSWITAIGCFLASQRAFDAARMNAASELTVLRVERMRDPDRRGHLPGAGCSRNVR
jgi:hypothetical protein